MKKINIINLIKTILVAMAFSLFLTIIVACLIGFSGLIVVGSSSEPDIPRLSLAVINKNVEFEELKAGEFITFSYGKGYITHQIIAICEDGYFQFGETITAVVEGEEIPFEFASTKENINIITRQKNKQVSVESSDYLNYEQNFVGRVVWVFPTIGKIVNYIQTNTPQVVVALVMLYCCTLIIKKDDEYVRLF